MSHYHTLHFQSASRKSTTMAINAHKLLTKIESLSLILQNNANGITYLSPWSNRNKETQEDQKTGASRTLKKCQKRINKNNGLVLYQFIHFCGGFFFIVTKLDLQSSLSKKDNRSANQLS